MASYRSFVPPPNQNPIPPPQQQRGNQNQYPPNRSSYPPPPPPSYQNPNAHHNTNYTSTSSSSSHHYPPPPLQQPQQYPYVQQPPPPAPPLNSQQPPPPMYYPSSQYSQFNPQSIPPPPPSAAPPPPPPSTPPHNSVIPPPPPTNPPSHPPPPPSSHQVKERSRNESGGRSSSGHSKGLPPKQHHKSSGVHGRVPHGPNGPAGRVETEEERKARKKREYEKQRQEEKHRHQLKESQSSVLHKTQMLSSSAKGHGSIVGSRLGDKRTPFLTAERAENRLKKPTTFLCKLKFRNELPDPTAQPKLLSMNTNKDQYTKYTITSLEKMYKPQLFVEPDLGIPLDLLDLSVYNPPSIKPPLAPEDEELLRDDELTTPVKQNGIKKKDRPEDKGFSWLVKTQYISPLSMDQAKMSLTEKQAKELRETKGGRNLLENLNDRESQIKAIEASFEAAKSVPVHSKDPSLYPVEILPLLPDFDRYEDQFVLASFDNDPTADSEAYSKLPKSTRDDLESKAIMKSFVGGGSEKFLAYMVPSADELDRDIYEEQEEISYNWVREYNWDVRGDTGDDPTTFLVTFGKDSAKYVPLGTKLNLRKKRAKEGRSHEEVEHYPVPSRITVRNRPPPLEIKESGGYNNKNRKDVTPNSKRGRSSIEEVHESRHKSARRDNMDNFSEAEDDMSE
ncbi:Protein PAF1 [Ranunculus cassubicifolius]